MNYHYIIGVASHPAIAGDKAGKLFLKYFLTWSQEEFDEFNLIKDMSENKMWKVTIEEALKGSKCSKIMSSLHGLKLAANTNQASLHHFVTEEELEVEVFESLVWCANSNERERELLKQSRMKI